MFIFRNTTIPKSILGLSDLMLGKEPAAKPPVYLILDEILDMFALFFYLHGVNSSKSGSSISVVCVSIFLSQEEIQTWEHRNSKS